MEGRGLYERALYWFTQLSKIPRGSKNEAAVADFLVRFAKKCGLKTVLQRGVIDGECVNNVIVKKDGKNAPPVILQAHIDMVCVKDCDSNHDFLLDAIELVFCGNELRANKTTLGADNGAGAAIIMALLESSEIEHPPIEAVFTCDEESGMTGARRLDYSLLSGETVINLDSEEDDTICIGCAGGIYANVEFDTLWEDAPKDAEFVGISIGGLVGGHSGTEITRLKPNANRILGRVIEEVLTDSRARIAFVEGGTFSNAIAASAQAIAAVHDLDALKGRIAALEAELNALYEPLGERISIAVASVLAQNRVLEYECANRLAQFLSLVADGVIEYRRDLPSVAQTSSNIGKVRQTESAISVLCFVRSFTNAGKLRAVHNVSTLASLLGARFFVSNESFGWEPKPNAPLVKTAVDVYKRLFLHQPKIEAVHAGLECGHFSKQNPHWQMISIGPNITGAHTSAETLYLDSFKKTCVFVEGLLAELQKA